MARIVLVPKDSPILADPSTKALNRYPNGTVLVQTDAAAGEAGESGEVPSPTGLKLQGVGPDELARARSKFRPVGEAGAAPAEAEAPVVTTAFVEFIGPPDAKWIDKLRDLNLTVLSYQPESSYLCYGPESAFRAAMQEVRTTEGTPAIVRITEQTAALKVRLLQPGEAGDEVVITVVGEPGQRDQIHQQLGAVPGIELLDGAGNDALGANRLRYRARIKAGAQDALLKLPRVLSIEPFVYAIPEDEMAGLILAGLCDALGHPSGSYLRWLRDHVIDGRGVTIGIVDAGIDVAHPAFSGRARDLHDGAKDWHATMVAGHAAGSYLDEIDPNRFIYGLGTAPAAELLSQDKTQSATFLCKQTVTEAGPSGARGSIQNNSWGRENRDPMDYGSEEAVYDQMVRNADPHGGQPRPLTICFSSGNSDARGLTRPKAAKNLIVTGNSENYRPDVGGDGSDNIREIYSGTHGSSWGNCGDGRVRPHVVAPGEWTSSANFGCAEGEAEFISPRLTWGGGSSGASPKTAGACALLTQWWRAHNSDRAPSPAMLRALIVNGAEPILTGGPIPNKRQGWGRLHLQNSLAPDLARVLEDQVGFLSHPLDSREWRVRVADPSRPVKITLAWTDPPGPIGTGGSPETPCVVNKLALRAEADRHLYRGCADLFQNGWSAPDGPAATEGADNLQNIFLPPGAATGAIRVTVIALNVTTNCLTGEPVTPQQDFALVIANAQLDTLATPSSVVVAVDRNASNPPPAPGSNGYWSDAPGNGDSYLVPPPAPAPATDPPPPPAPPQPSAGDDAWWDQPDLLTSRAETERSQPSGLDPAMAGSLADGFALLRRSSHEPDTVNPTGEGGTPAARYAAAEADLNEAVARLIERLDREAADPAGAGRPTRAVLVVGAGTRVTREAIAGLRRLSFQGTVDLVSDDPNVLSFLAQRVGRRTGLRYRLAGSRAGLAEEVRAALAEAGGWQRIVSAAAPPQATADGIIRRFQFGVVKADRAILIRVRSAAAGGLKQVRLKRASQSDVVWTPQAAGATPPTDGISTSAEDGVVEFHAPASPLRGAAWTVEVLDPPGADDPSVTAWALGGPPLRLDDQPIATPGGAPADGAEKRLLRLTGGPGVTFRRASVPPPRIANAEGPILAEAEEIRTIAARPTRLDHPASTATDGDPVVPISTPVLTHVIDVPAPRTGAAIVDVEFRALGADADGSPFARSVRTSLVRLRPMSEWEAEVASATPSVLYTTGRVAGVEIRDGAVASLKLTRDGKSRSVTVGSPGLGRELAALGFAALRDARFVFGVTGTVLQSVFRWLEGSAPSGASADGPGIEGPLRELVSPRSEADETDYPQATRFVRAANFRANRTGRAIKRVVIHITDGGTSIEGPISWFQNPASGVSAHYIVGQNGEVVQMVRDRDVAWHANNANGDSIGIEHCARAPGAHGRDDAGLYPTPLQYAASAALVRWLCETYNIPIDRDHILGHSEADTRTTHSRCPNAVWNWDYYMSMVEAGASFPPTGGTGAAGAA